MIIFTRDFNCLETIDGPTISIINNIRSYKKKEKIFIFNSLTRSHSSYTDFKHKKLNIQTVKFKNFFEYVKLLCLNYREIKKSKIFEFHCIYDFFGCFISCIILRFINPNSTYKFFLRGMANKKIFQKKKILKILYLFLIKTIIPKKNSELITTSIYEKNLSNEIFKNMFKIRVEPNKIENKIIFSCNQLIKKKKNNLNLFFMSNITWKKNFDFVFNVLKKIDFQITLNIYGSIYEDKNKFMSMINILKNYHKVNYNGEYNRSYLNEIIKKNHLMILPTLDENFGHTIVECLLSSRPCLISNNTPWSDINFYNAGYALPLDATNTYINVIRDFYLMDNKNYQEKCLNAKKYLITKLKNKDF